MKPLLFFGIILLIILNGACEEDGPETSSFTASSHKAGKSCNECHDNVQVCGTVYDSVQTNTKSNVIVKFSTTNDTTGLVKSTLEVDKSGNFYTVNSIEFKSLYPFVVYPDGTNARYMQSSVSSGDCNSCHKNGSRIWIK